MSLVTFTKNRWPWNYGLTNYLERRTATKEDEGPETERTLPVMNVKEHENDFELEFACPGFEKKDFHVTMKDHVLRIYTIKESELTEKKDDYALREFDYRHFERAVKLPKTIDDSKQARATYKNGILKVNLLKKEETRKRPKRIIRVV